MRLHRSAAMLPGCATRDELMGIEGAAAREYFAALTDIVPKDIQFAGRSTQPQGDVVNAALSYGYARAAISAFHARVR